MVTHLNGVQVRGFSWLYNTGLSRRRLRFPWIDLAYF